MARFIQANDEKYQRATSSPLYTVLLSTYALRGRADIPWKRTSSKAKVTVATSGNRNDAVRRPSARPCRM